MKHLIITFLATILMASSSSATAQIYETSNDPDSLCITTTNNNDNGGSINNNNIIKLQLTGYKASKDCRGYVYCQDGYLMGGGVIPCSFPNQIFDETLTACTYWQNVDSATLSENCPEFDDTKMILPDQYDENANEERFFCGHSWSHAKSICEPCVGGSRLECGDLGYNCFAGVTGCPSSSSSSSSLSANNTNNDGGSSSLNSIDDNSSGSSNSNSNSNSNGKLQIGQSVENNNVDVQSQQHQPSNPAAVVVDNNECTNHSDCPISNQYCNQGYCGQCSSSSEEESSDNNISIGCSVDQVCRTASCHVAQTRGPGKCYSEVELTSFCRALMKDASYVCNLDTMVCEEGGVSISRDEYSSVVGPVMESESESVQEEEQQIAPPIQDEISTSIVTKQPEAKVPLYTNPTGNNYFCGYSFSTVTSECLQSKPCPNGFASKYCEATDGCFRATQCADEYEEAASSAATASSSSASSVSGSVSLASNDSTAAATSIQQPPPPPTATASTAIQQQQPPTTTAAAASTATQPQPSPTTAAGTTATQLQQPPPTTAAGTTATQQQPPPTTAAGSTATQQQPPTESTNNGLSLETFNNTPPSPAVVISKPPPTNYWGNFNHCLSHDACTLGQFCNEGFCGQCSSESGIGCSVDQVCRTASCHVTQTPGPGVCYDKGELNNFCRTEWKDESYQCNLDLMVCETSKKNDVIQVAVETPTTPTDSTPGSVISSPTTTATSPPSSKPTMTPSKAPITLRPTNAKIRCSICGPLQVVTDSAIFYHGTELSCTELVDEVFIKDGITMGSDKCISSQAQYSAACCIDPPQNPCNLCRSGDNELPLKSEVMVVSMVGETESCLEVFQSLQSLREESSWQCIGSKRELQAKCCDSSPISTPTTTATSPPSLNPTTSRPTNNASISTSTTTATFSPSSSKSTETETEAQSKEPLTPEAEAEAQSKAPLTPLPCSICGNLQVVTDATIFYDGTEVSCTELVDEVLIEDGITMGSDECLTSQELYSAACCIDPPQNPCNLCRSGDTELPLKSEVMVVSMVGETEPCLEVFQSLQSLREESSWQCIGSKRELQAKCCDGSSDNNDVPAPTPGMDRSPSGGNGDEPYDYNNAPIPAPGVNWSPLGGDEPQAGSPTDGYYYKQPDWNWNNRFRNGSCRIASTTTVSTFALFGITVCMALA